MRRITVCCITGQSANRRKKKKQIQESKPSLEERMEQEEPQMQKNDNGEIADSTMGNTSSSSHVSDDSIIHNRKDNIIVNHDFSQGLKSWHSNSCDGFAVSSSSDRPGLLSRLVGCYAVVSNRKQCWQGIEQDITARVSAGLNYSVAAVVGVSGQVCGSVDVIATLKLEQKGSATQYLRVGKATVSKGQLEMLEGDFCLPNVPDRVVFYIEGPSAGADILVASVNVCSSGLVSDEKNGDLSTKSVANNVILNNEFSRGMDSWHSNSCDAYVVSIDLGHPGHLANDIVQSYAVVTNRKESWQGLEQDITSKVCPSLTYFVSAIVGVSGEIQGSAEEVVAATLKLEHNGSATRYLLIGKTSVCKGKWKKLEGSFCLSTMPDRAVFYLEGPSPGANILIKSVFIGSKSEGARIDHGCSTNEDENLIVNPNFEDGVNNWTGRGCKIAVQSSAADGKIVPKSGKVFAVATGRTQSWHGIQQEITGKVQRKLAYEVTAIVRIYGNNVTSADVRATLWVQNPDNRDQYIGIANLQGKDSDWVQLQGKFLLNGNPKKIVVYLEGPPPGTDILVNSFTLKRAKKVPPSPLPIIENPAFGVNILQNSNLSDGTNGWFPLGNCSLSVATGSPHVLPPLARESLGIHEPLSGRCISVTKRTQTWMGPAQMITDKVKLFLTYQIAAWVKIGPGANGPQNVNIAISVDNNWVNGGQVEINDDRWHEIGSSFRIEKQPSKVMVYIQGPSGGTDFMVGGLQIFAVDRAARFKHLRRLTDKIRKCDVTLKFTGVDSTTLQGTFVKVRQTQNSFPLGTCISRTNIDNEDYVSFFVNNFNWAVFGNELKWYWTESQQGSLNYKDADDMVALCNSHNIAMRGHCIFWDVDGTVQPWIKSLNKQDLMKAVQTRLTDLLTRYKGQFKHYDVNNEMLHGSFYPDRLGKDIRPYMFKTANQLDPSATLFVNDYHVEDGCDTRSNPERYIEQILDLQEQGAPVGGVGIQGHIDSPVGPVVCSALDNLGILGLPIWFTELDVSSINEYIRADDLEVMLREAYAHPSVEGIMLWGFWELFMSRENSHLVDAEGELNEAGRRFLALKKEWLSHASGHIDEQTEFEFRGFHGSYTVEIVGLEKKVVKMFVVEKGDTPLVLDIDLSKN
ncbi:Endo-1,4-beta-xylanase 1 [Linum perenne]